MATDPYASIRKQNRRIMGLCGDEGSRHKKKAKDMTPEKAADEFYKIREQVGVDCVDADGNVTKRGYKERAMALRNRAEWNGVEIKPIEDLNDL